jgi:solute carrier family 44 (choline transporter-like protein), member 2/4/5
MLEKCLKFISKQAYIQTAIHGTCFCTAAKDAFFTVARNIFTIGAVSVVTGMALVVGKIWVCTVAGISSYYYFHGAYEGKVRF